MKKVIKQEKTVDTNNLSKTMMYAYMYGGNLFILIGINGECRYTFKNANDITNNVTVGSKETLKSVLKQLLIEVIMCISSNILRSALSGI